MTHKGMREEWQVKAGVLVRCTIINTLRISLSSDIESDDGENRVVMAVEKEEKRRKKKKKKTREIFLSCKLIDCTPTLNSTTLKPHTHTTFDE